MYDTNSGVFLSIIVIAYLWLLAVLAWWALDTRLGRLVKKNVVRASVRVLRAVRFGAVQLRAKRLKSGTAAGNSYSAPSSGRNWKS
jgi:hypothetical protein